MALSGWRRLVHLTDFAESVMAEQQYPDLKSQAAKLLRALKDQGLEDKSINEETQKRYLSLGMRVKMHQGVLARWEMYHQRDSLVDSITTVRNVLQSSDVEDDIAYVLQQLFLQQRAKLRTFFQSIEY